MLFSYGLPAVKGKLTRWRPVPVRASWVGERTSLRHRHSNEFRAPQAMPRNAKSYTRLRYKPAPIEDTLSLMMCRVLKWRHSCGTKGCMKNRRSIGEDPRERCLGPASRRVGIRSERAPHLMRMTLTCERASGRRARCDSCVRVSIELRVSPDPP